MAGSTSGRSSSLVKGCDERFSTVKIRFECPSVTGGGATTGGENSPGSRRIAGGLRGADRARNLKLFGSTLNALSHSQSGTVPTDLDNVADQLSTMSWFLDSTDQSGQARVRVDEPPADLTRRGFSSVLQSSFLLQYIPRIS